MAEKIDVIFSAKYCWVRLIVPFIFLISQNSFSQPNKQDFHTQRLLMQLASSFLNVAKQNQIDIDSGLALASKRAYLNRMIVVGRSFEDIIENPANAWVTNENIQLAKNIVSTSSKPMQTSLMNLIGYFYIFQPAARKNDLDSALLYLIRGKYQAEKDGDTKSFFQSLSGIGKCYLERGDLHSADSVFMQVINQAVKSNDKQQEAIAWDYWGTYSPFLPNIIADRINRLKKANALYEKLDDKENQINTLTNIGYLSFAAGKTDDSKQSFLQALSMEKAISFPFTHYTTFMLAFLCAINGDHESQLKYNMELVKTAEATKDSIALAYFYASRADADLFYMNNKQEGLEWGQKSLAEFERLGGDPAMYLMADNMARNLIISGKNREAIQLTQRLIKLYPPVSPIDRQQAYFTLASAYEQNNFAQGERYYLEAEKIQKETESIRGTIGAFDLYLKIGDFYFKNRKYEKSRHYLNKALTYPMDDQIYSALEDIQDHLAVIDSASGDFRNAFDHARKANVFHNYGVAKSQSKEVSELRIQYEIEKKDNNIKLLSQQAALQNTQIKQDKFTKNVMIAGAAVLLLFIGLLYNRYRLKQRSNKQLEFQQKEITQKNSTLQHLIEEKEWLIKEVHHRVKNNLHTVICLLESQAAYLENDALKAIENSQHRIYAMSLIHQKLYQSEDVKAIDMSVYLPEFIQYLKDSFDTGSQVVFQLEIEPLQLGISQAIPIALIINEAVTNSIKYAFPAKAKGIIKIAMNQVDNQIMLVIADNGVGIDTATVNVFSDSLGLKLMKGLSEDISAQISFENRQGTIIKLQFEADALNNNYNRTNEIKETKI